MIGKALEGKLLSTAELRQEGASGLMHVDLHMGFYSNAVCVIMQLWWAFKDTHTHKYVQPDSDLRTITTDCCEMTVFTVFMIE